VRQLSLMLCLFFYFAALAMAQPGAAPPSRVPHTQAARTVKIGDSRGSGAGRENLGSQGLMAERKSKAAGKRKKPSTRRGSSGTGGTKTMAAAKAEFRREQAAKAVPEGGFKFVWHMIIMSYLYPFQIMNDLAGPIASNAFGIGLMVLFFVLPRIFTSGRTRELKLKERLVRAKNTRVRVRGAATLDEYHTAVNMIQEDDLAYPLKGLRKMLRLPPADPASYSQAVKDIKKEYVLVNGKEYEPAPRSLDKAIQDIKQTLVRCLHVRESDASQMTSTIIAKSCHTRSSDDAEKALKAIVIAENELVELKRYHKRPLKVLISESNVEVKRSWIYEVVPSTSAVEAGESRDPMMYVKCKWSMQFRSNTDEGNVTIRRYYLDRKREKKEKAKLEAKSVGTRGREMMLMFYGHTQGVRSKVDWWVDQRVRGLFRPFTKAYGYLFPPPPPTWGEVGEALRTVADVCSQAKEKEVFMGAIQSLGKISLETREASEALGNLLVGEVVEEAQVKKDLIREVLHVDGLEFKPSEIGTVKAVKGLERHLRSVLGCTKEEAKASVKCLLCAACRTRTGNDSLQILTALCQNLKGMVAVIPHTASHYPVKIRTEGKGGTRPKALRAEVRCLFKISDVDPVDEQQSIWGFLEVCIAISVPISENPPDPGPGIITIKPVDKPPQAPKPAPRPPLPPASNTATRARRGSVSEKTQSPMRNKAEKLATLQVQRGGIVSSPNTPLHDLDILPPIGTKDSTPSSKDADSSSFSSTVSSVTTSPMSVPEYMPSSQSSAASSAQTSPGILDPSPTMSEDGKRGVLAETSPQPRHQSDKRTPKLSSSHEERWKAPSAKRPEAAAGGSEGAAAATRKDVEKQPKVEKKAETILKADVKATKEAQTAGKNSGPHVAADSPSSNGTLPHKQVGKVDPKLAKALARRFLRKSGLTPPATPPQHSPILIDTSSPSHLEAHPRPDPTTPSPPDCVPPPAQ